MQLTLVGSKSNIDSCGPGSKTNFVNTILCKENNKNYVDTKLHYTYFNLMYVVSINTVSMLMYLDEDLH